MLLSLLEQPTIRTSITESNAFWSRYWVNSSLVDICFKYQTAFYSQTKSSEITNYVKIPTNFYIFEVFLAKNYFSP